MADLKRIRSYYDVMDQEAAVDELLKQPLTEAQKQEARAVYARRGVGKAGVLPENLRVSEVPEAPSVVEPPKASDIAPPIPIASARVRADVPGATKGAIPATTSTSPALPAGTSSTVKPPPAEAGSGGDDELGRLSMGQALVRALEGSGSIIAGRDLRSGAADTLGERMKQIEALRAKREERSMELAREDEQSSALVQQYKSLAAQGLVPELPLLDKLPIKQAASLIKTYGSLPGMAAKAAETTALTPVKVASGLATAAGKEAQTAFVVEKTGRVRELLPLEVEQKRAQTAKINADIDNLAKEFKLKEQTALNQSYKDEQEKALKLNELAEKEKGFGGYINLANDLSALEAVAPGFVTQGKAPDWLTTESLAAAQKFPRSADPRVIRFLSKYADLTNTERHRLYGSAQTEGELRSFLQQLSDDPFFAGPEVIAAQMQGFAENAATKATSTLGRYNNVFSPRVVDTVLGGEFKPLYAEGGVFAGLGQKSPFAATPKRKAQPANTTAMLDENGKPKYVPNDQVQAAEAAGWKRE